MKRITIVFVCMIALFSCKKKESTRCFTCTLQTYSVGGVGQLKYLEKCDFTDKDARNFEKENSYIKDGITHEAKCQ